MMLGDPIEEKLNQFNATHAPYRIEYGGDGALLRAISNKDSSTIIIPIRDYGRCERHKNLFDEIIDDWDSFKDKLTITRHNRLFCEPLDLDGNVMFQEYEDKVKGIAEITMRSEDPTEAVRFNVWVNDKIYLQNCIADAVIYASEMGSHGYWKSVTRTIFRGKDNVGLGFIAPTYGINNLILSANDKVVIEFVRGCNLLITADKFVTRRNVSEKYNRFLLSSRDGREEVKIAGYDLFCCYDCRKNRNSTILNDMYFV